MAAAAACSLLAFTSACGAVPGSGGGSGGPIVVMTFAPYGTKTVNLPGMPTMAEAFVEDVNASGGINGRELKLITCNEGDDPVGAADCADLAVEAGAVAVVGSYSQHGSSFMPGLEGAGIPFIGGYGISEEEFTSPLSYPVNGGVPALLAGNGRQLAEADCERVSIVRPDTATGDMLAIYLDAGLRAGKHPGATVDVQAAEDAKDYSSVAERALGDDPASSCVTAVLGKRTGTFLDSYVRLDPENARFSSVLGSIGQTTVDSTGGAAGPLEGVHATGWYPPENDVSWNRMREAVDKYAPGGNRIDVSAPGEQTTWVAYTVFQAVARTLDPGDITADNVRRALDSHSGVSTGNLTPLLRWRFEDLLSLRDHPRIVNTAVTYQVVRDGRLVAQRKGFVEVRHILEREDAALG